MCATAEAVEAGEALATARAAMVAAAAERAAAAAAAAADQRLRVSDELLRRKKPQSVKAQRKSVTTKTRNLLRLAAHPQ